MLSNFYNFFIIHRAVKWWKRVFYHLINLSLVNANILYNEAKGKKMPHKDFRVAVAMGLLEGFSSGTSSLSSHSILFTFEVNWEMFPRTDPKTE